MRNQPSSLRFISGQFDALTSLFSQPLSTGLITSNAKGTATGAQATATVNNLGLGMGAFLNPSLFANAAPNTVLFNSLGLKILLNEQILSGDGITGMGITTNAIHIGFNKVLLGTSLANGDIFIAQSQAFATPGAIVTPPAVPEPGVWAMTLLGFSAIGLMVRCRRQSAPGAFQLA